MEQGRLPKPGEIYNQSKDKPYQIIALAEHSETGAQMVVYQALYGDFKMYVRPLASYLSENGNIAVDDHKVEEVQGKVNEPTEDNAQRDNAQEDKVDLLLMKFLDAESYYKKLEVLSSNRKSLSDRLINDMAVSLDCTVEEGPLEERIQGLINCLQAMCRFENKRLR